ncbi:hypothetical protein EMWEY_00001130 [Eimeria maxima]|uniref:Uncharacterized protein n=1 Tax=Eimeria maxima TaxID=5804 RepID=U6MAX5_EIMMA|nr:hypothetical protein EMWEY_00001130 [Eimeria maxima]CDJ61176.1 hypothetical protein EMWEY_00001130 [Eimeria maxima]
MQHFWGFSGRVCPAGTASDKGPKCLPGFYSSVTGLTDVSECLPCPAGHYCDYGDDNSAPSKVTGKCPEGLMSLNTGLFGAGHALRTIEAKPGQDAQCVVCDPGFQCTAGQRLACDRGFYSDGDSGNPTCKQCLAGHYCSEEGTSREQMEKQQCPAGAYCAAGVASVPVPASHPCPAGNYCPKVRDDALNFCEIASTMLPL